MSLAAGRPITVERRIAVPEDCVTAAAEYLPAGPCYVGIAPGSGGASKRWPLSRFIEVAAEQSRRGRVPVFFLGPQERAWRGELQEAVPGALFPEYDARGAPRAGALLTIALARQLAVGLANDSGGGHLLAAGGQPMVSLYGHTDERKFAPPYGPRTAIRAKDHGGAEMKRIPVQSVLDAIDEQLVQPGS
jgi:ADP-heptose:LPS heptosyltransferase